MQTGFLVLYRVHSTNWLMQTGFLVLYRVHSTNWLMQTGFLVLYRVHSTNWLMQTGFLVLYRVHSTNWLMQTGFLGLLIAYTRVHITNGLMQTGFLLPRTIFRCHYILVNTKYWTRHRFTSGACSNEEFFGPFTSVFNSNLQYCNNGSTFDQRFL